MNTDEPHWDIQFSERAASQRDALPADRAALLSKGLRALARDPFSKATSAHTASNYHRRAYVAPNLLIEYGIIHGTVIVMIIDVFDESQTYLVEEDLDD